MTRPPPPRINSGVQPVVRLQIAEPDPAKLHGEHRDPDGRATPETKAREMLKLERARQRTAIRKMNATHEELAVTTQVLLELLSDPAFVALLRAHGFNSIPRILHQRLMERR